MMSIGRESKPSASAFLAQLAALGFFSRIVLILAILALLSLNDYFTTQSQIASLLPVSALIILLLVLVAVTDAISGRMIQALIKRLGAIHSLFGFASVVSDPEQSSDVQQRHYLRTVFLPFVMSVLPAPMVIAVLISTTPLLFIISVIQSITNGIIVYRYNRLIAARYVKKGRRDSDQVSNDEIQIEERAYLLRRGRAASQMKALELAVEESPAYATPLQNKREALRTSNLMFRALILISSAALAIYKLSSLGSLVGYFLLNNTLRYAIVVIAEYLWPAYRHLSFRQACDQIALSLTPERQLLERLQTQHEKEEQAQLTFNDRMKERISQKPYLRFKDFRLSRPRSDRPSIIDALTGRIELNQVTLVRICGSNLCSELAFLIQNRGQHLIDIEVKGVAVCAQLSIDAPFWNHLPIADPQRSHIFATSLLPHFPVEHRVDVSRLIDTYNLTRFYLEGDPEPLAIQQLSSKQIKRMRSLLTLLDLILNPRCLWLAPFIMDPFEETESLELFSFYSKEVSAEQRTVFLLSRQLPINDAYRYYELTRSTLKSIN